MKPISYIIISFIFSCFTALASDATFESSSAIRAHSDYQKNTREVKQAYLKDLRKSLSQNTKKKNLPEVKRIQAEIEKIETELAKETSPKTQKLKGNQILGAHILKADNEDLGILTFHANGWTSGLWVNEFKIRDEKVYLYSRDSRYVTVFEKHGSYWTGERAEESFVQDKWKGKLIRPK
jgi:hypothetical protein